MDSITNVPTYDPPEAPTLTSCGRPITNEVGHRILFHHPGYSDDEDLLLVLSAFDYPDGGLHHQTALDALGIIAANATGGYLTESRDGPQISDHPHAPLRQKKYWFHVLPPKSYKGSLDDWVYPICPTFRDWVFPQRLPESWPQTRPSILLPKYGRESNFSALVSSRDSTCRITGYSSGTEACHLCPKSEIQWFRRNLMGSYNINPNLRVPTDDVSNAILLRRDLHFEFDSRVFVIVPKGPTIGFVVHFLEPTTDIGPAHHNQQLHPIGEVTPQFLFARFAWAIFPALSMFMQQGVRRYVTRIRADDGNKTETLWAETGEQKPTKGSKQKHGTRTDSIAEESEPEQIQEDLHMDESLDSLLPEELEALEASEMEEDLSAMRLRFPDFPPFKPTHYHSHHVDDQAEATQEQDQQALDATWGTVSWYPGHRHAARLKEKWLKEQRPPSYRNENEWHGEGSGKAFLEAHGYEIRGDGIEEESDRLPLSNKTPQ
ncbi:MAG: hypothetical protein M1840_005000 [Geoglossum simile]|nr:MAG: hypothetical protein M1840_005000 [Geoglossum simile]